MVNQTEKSSKYFYGQNAIFQTAIKLNMLNYYREIPNVILNHVITDQHVFHSLLLEWLCFVKLCSHKNDTASFVPLMEDDLVNKFVYQFGVLNKTLPTSFSIRADTEMCTKMIAH